MTERRSTDRPTAHPELGEADGEPTPLGGGITNRNYRSPSAASEYVIRVPGKDTNLLEIDRARRDRANQQAAAPGVAPPVAALLEDPPCLVTTFIERQRDDAEELREAGRARGGGLGALHDSGAPCRARSTPSGSSSPTPRPRRERGAEIPDVYGEAHGHADEIEAALSGPEHEPGPLPQRPPGGQLPRRRRAVWIVDWEYAGMGDRYFDLGNFAVNNELDDDADRRRCSRPTSGSRRTRRRWRPCA